MLAVSLDHLGEPRVRPQYRQYSKDPELGTLQDEARAARRGLWAGSAPVEPWLFRRKAGGRV